MKVKAKSIKMLVIGIFFFTSAYSETWNIIEGADGEWQGKWTMDGTKRSFSYGERGPYIITASCMVIRDGDFIGVRKYQVSDGNPCNYIGQQDGNEITEHIFAKMVAPILGLPQYQINVKHNKANQPWTLSFKVYEY